ncbi:MAG: WG repeat-containing protein [Spirochaetes bacterium]|nr:WG repeat-containing protein [Spirochaetota bacterium]
MRKLISTVLALFMAAGILPLRLTAQNIDDKSVTWIGSKAEYEKTIKAFFDPNGLRKVPVGDIKADGSLTNIKYGLVNAAGIFVAKPVYDKIEAIYHYAGNNPEAGHNTVAYPAKRTELIFVGGYVQAVRGGKMGLLDTKGNEVVPCKYDQVGLPSEGICRIINKADGVSRLGYWSLKKGREIVPPKYAVNGNDATAFGSIRSSESMNRSADLKDLAIGGYGADFYTLLEDERAAVWHDFNGGYALVPSGKVEGELVYAQIIDADGKEILKGGPYPFRSGGKYPQYAQYMVYEQLSKQEISIISDAGDKIKKAAHYNSGVVGPEGVIIPAQYHGGIRGSSVRWFASDANMFIIPEFSLVATAKAPLTGKEAAARYGVVDFKNKTVIPFEFDYEFFNYDYMYKVFYGMNKNGGTPTYSADGKRKIKHSIVNEEGKGNTITNGYFPIYSNKSAGFGEIATGKEYLHESLKYSYSDTQYGAYKLAQQASPAGTAWVPKGKYKAYTWTLVDIKSGKTLTSSPYSDISGWNTYNKNLAYSVVKLNGKYGIADANGKELLPCEYASVISKGRYIVIENLEKKKGILDTQTWKFILPCKYDFIGTSTDLPYLETAGAMPIAIGESQACLFGTNGEKLTDAYLYFNSASRGLFHAASGDYFGPDGKIVFNRALKYGYYNKHNVEIGEDLTLIVRNGKVGYTYASRLADPSKQIPVKVPADTVKTTVKDKYYLIANPDKKIYRTGESFDLKGFIAHVQKPDGTRGTLDNSKIYFMAGKEKITDGYKFTSGGGKVLSCYYDGAKLGIAVNVTVVDVSKVKLLDDGKYTISVFGKYLRITKNYMELSDALPAQKFIIKLVQYSDARGPMYNIIAEDGRYIMQRTYKDGEPVVAGSLQNTWKISKYADFCTIRDYSNQRLLVNAAGGGRDNGTKVIISSSQGSAPANGKLVFTPVK